MNWDIQMLYSEGDNIESALFRSEISLKIICICDWFFFICIKRIAENFEDDFLFLVYLNTQWIRLLDWLIDFFFRFCAEFCIDFSLKQAEKYSFKKKKNKEWGF